MDGLSQDVILGRPWERMTRIKHDNRDDGSCYTTAFDKQGNSVVFGVRWVPPLQLKEKVFKGLFEVCLTRWGKGAHACASPKCRGKVNGQINDEMLIDCGSELCLLSKDLFDTLNLPIDLELDWVIGSATSQRGAMS